MDKEEIIIKIRKFKMLLREYFELEKVYLFGSYAHGNVSVDSDIDVAVVVNKLNGDYFDTIPLLWRLRREVDDRIEPMLFERGKDKSGMLEQIEKTGIEILD